MAARPSMPNNDLIPRIKDAADCRAIFRRFYPTHWREQGNCVCPWHNDSEDRPSLVLDREHAHCFGEDQNRDAIDIWQAATGASKGDAIRELAKELGLWESSPARKPTSGKSSSFGNSNPDSDKSDKKKPQFTGRWAKLVGSDFPHDAHAYLSETRGLSSSIETLKKKKCIGFDQRSQSVSFPVLNWDESEIYGIQLCPVAGWDKKFVTGTSTAEGILRISNGGDHIVVSEGVFDACAIFDACSRELFLDSVSLFSAGGWKKVSSLPGVPILFFDLDVAGLRAAAKCVKAFGAKIACVDYSLMPDGIKDPNDLLRAEHADVILKMVKTARRPANDAETSAMIEDLLSRLDREAEKSAAKMSDEAAKKFLEDIDRFKEGIRREGGGRGAGSAGTAGESCGCSDDYREVDKRDGAYWKIEFDKAGRPNPIKITNFTLEILRNFSSPAGMNRLIRVAHEDGKFSIESEIQPAVMANRNLFAAWVLSQGNFLFRGTYTDLEKIWSLELGQNDGKIIYRPDHIGWIRSKKIWIFSDCAIGNSEIYRPDQEDIVWIGDYGYQAVTLEASGQDVRTDACGSIYMPSLRWDLSEKAVDETRLKMIDLLKRNLGGFEAYLALGFVAACAYADELFREFKLPILFIFGRRQCGKNTLASLIMSHFGLGEDCADNVSAVTKTALSRKLAYFSSIPVWVDEYRSGDPHCQAKDSILRSAYDRVGASKGTLGPGIIAPKVRAPLIITGESFPSDSALTSRCAIIQLSEGRRDGKILEEIRRLVPSLSGIFCQMVKKKTEATTAALIEDVKITKDWLEGKGMDPRLASIYAVLGEAFADVYNPEDVNKDSQEFIGWILSEAGKLKAEKDEKLLTNEFLADIEVLKSQGKLNGKSVELKFRNVNGELQVHEVFLWLREMYNIWSEDRKRRGEQAWSYGDLQKYLREERYFVCDGVNRRIGKDNRKSTVLSAEKMPEDILSIFQGWRRDDET